MPEDKIGDMKLEEGQIGDDQGKREEAAAALAEAEVKLHAARDKSKQEEDEKVVNIASKSKSQVKRESVQAGKGLPMGRLPNVGDRVYYKQSPFHPSAEATITAIHSTKLINLRVDGADMDVTSVPMHEGAEDPKPNTWRFM